MPSRPLRLEKPTKTNMCGIVVYVGNRAAYPIIIQGLNAWNIVVTTAQGLPYSIAGCMLPKPKVRYRIWRLAKQSSRSGVLGIGHTRWATHGAPNNVNAHPHTSNW